MPLKLISCLCIVIFFIGVQSQRVWGPSGYNTGFSNSWTSNGFSNQNVGSWGSNKPNQPNFNRPVEDNSFYGSSGNDKSGFNSNKPGKSNSGTSGSAFNIKKSDEKKLASIINAPDTNTNLFSTSDNDGLSSWGQLPGSSNQNSKTNKWDSINTNNNKPDEEQSNLFSSVLSDNNFSSYRPSRPSGTSSQYSKQNNEMSNEINNRPNSNSFSSGSNNDFSSWQSNKASGSNGQNSNNFNNNNKPMGNDVQIGSDYEENSWNSKNKEKGKPNKNKWTTTTSKPSKSSMNTQNSSNFGNWNGNENTEELSNIQNNNKSTADTSILDTLDKNDWYFKEKYPKPPFKTVLNINVGELWNFDKNRRPNKNDGRNKDSNNSNNNRRRNRQAGERVEEIQCECISASLCDEEDMIITQEDIKYDWRPLEAFRCERLTEVCCTTPKLRFSNRANYEEENEGRLYCGQRKLQKSSFGPFGGNVGEPGEFPWNLQVQNSEINCSASLIHPQLALTAAHCVSNTQPNEINLMAGLWNSDNEPPQSRRVSKIILHPAYSSQNPRNDIALLVAENGFELNGNVNTICLPVTNDKWNPDECLVAGWKREEVNDEVVRVLQKGTVDFIPQPECQNILLVTDLWRNYILHDSFVCAREKTGSSECLENEGGPVMCPSRKQPDTYLQIGIVSKGMNCDSFGRPGIFTNVLKFLDWINKNHFELGLNYDLDIRSL